jgi:hypothetical protein
VCGKGGVGTGIDTGVWVVWVLECRCGVGSAVKAWCGWCSLGVVWVVQSRYGVGIAGR